MKKHLGKFMLAFVLVPCMLIMTACGGGQLDTKVNINTNGNYQVATYADFHAGVLELNLEQVVNAYKTTAIVKAEETKDTPAMDIDANIIISLNAETEEVLMAMKVKNKGKTVEGFVKDEFMYVTAEGQKVKVPFENADIEESMGISPITLHDIVAMFDGNEQEAFEIKKAVDGNVTKFEIVRSEIVDGQTFLFKGYFVFKDGKLTGIKIYNGIEGSINVEISLEPFEGTIEFPSFEGYSEIPNIQ